MKPKGGLGRGLAALLPAATPGVLEAEVGAIEPNPLQPRQHFDREALEELASSIREHGLLQPLLVSARPNGGYQLIAGERRWQAAQRAGLSRVPVVVVEATPQGLLELALVENIQRADLGAIEEAIAFRRLIDEFGLTQEQVAQRVGRSRVAVANTVRLLGLPSEAQAAIASGEISAGHGRALLMLEGADRQRAALRQVLRRGLTVRETEALAQVVTEPRAEPTEREARRVEPEVAALEDALRRALGTKVELRRGRRGGRIVIHYFSDEELGSILGLLGVDIEVVG